MTSSEQQFDGLLLADRWRLGPRLGAGAQAKTYLARDESAAGAAARVVVVKRLELGPKSGSTWKKFDLFEREIRTLRALEHPGIPSYLDSFESGHGVFNLVMARAPGTTLKAWAKHHRPNDAELRDVLRRVLEILRYLHGLHPPVIHRDIKPANLVRDDDGSMNLVDFGGVRDVLRPEGGSTVIGTFGYMAPEQLHGQATPATDLYGLGATIVALAGGVEPEQVPRNGLRMDLARHLGAMDGELREVLAAMVEPDPDARPQSALAVLGLMRRAKARTQKYLDGVANVANVTNAPNGTRRRALMAQSAAEPAIERAPPGVLEARHAVDEIAEFTGDLPRPLRRLVRLLLFCVGFSGFLSLKILRLVALPIIFGIVGALANQRNSKRIDRVEAKVAGGLDEGSAGFRAIALGRRSRRSRRSRPALAAAKNDSAAKDDSRSDSNLES